MAAKKGVKKTVRKTARRAKKSGPKRAGSKRATKKGATKNGATRKRATSAPPAAAAAVTGAAVPCVPASQAFALVMACAGQRFDVDTKLKDVFGDERRLQFCQCVSNRSGVPAGQVACQPSSTFGDVMDSISC
jgi:hypothetical protein